VLALVEKCASYTTSCATILIHRASPPPPPPPHVLLNASRYTRLLQVANKAEGSLLGDVLKDPDKGLDAIDPASLSETVVFTILTTADDAKGDNFIVDRDGVIIGIDNDHVLDAPFVRASWLSSLDGGDDETRSELGALVFMCSRSCSFSCSVSCSFLALILAL
jgi:hypothetical protein